MINADAQMIQQMKGQRTLLDAIHKPVDRLETKVDVRRSLNSRYGSTKLRAVSFCTTRLREIAHQFPMKECKDQQFRVVLYTSSGSSWHLAARVAGGNGTYNSKEVIASAKTAVKFGSIFAV